MVGVQAFVHFSDVRRIGARLEFAGAEEFFVVLIPHRKGLQLLSPCGKLPVRHRRDDAGIQPAGQKGGYRHIRHQLPLDGVQHQIPHPGHRGGKAVAVFMVGELPVQPRGKAAGVRLKHGALAGQQFLHVVEHTAARHAARAKQKNLRQTVFVHPRRHRRVTEQRFQLAAENQTVFRLRKKQRLDAAAVSGQKQRFCLGRPHRKGKDAVETLHTALAPLGVGVQQHLGVAVPRETVSPCRQRRPQLGGVVQLAVVHKGVLFFFVLQQHGLLPALDIHHRKPRMDERRLPADVQPPLVRTAPGKALLHGAVMVIMGTDGLGVPCDLSGYAAHKNPSS